MSQDLLSFLDDNPSESYSTPHTTTQPERQSTNNPWAEEDSTIWQSSTTAQTDGVNDDDDFGDFEDASVPAPIKPVITETKPAQIRHSNANVSISKPTPKPVAPSKPQAKAKEEGIGQHPFAGRMAFLFDDGDDEYDAGADELGDLATNPEAAMAYSKRIIAEQEAAAANAWRSERQIQGHTEYDQKSKTNSQPESVKRTRSAPKDPNVLFDAEDVSDDDDDDDDFGGFESGNERGQNDMSPPKQASKPVAKSMPAIDLLGLDDDTVAQPIENSSNRAFPPQTVEKNKTSQLKQYSQPDNDAWDDFETATPAESSSAYPNASPTPQLSRLQTTPSANPARQPDSSLPPTNIPPPSVLISLFPSIIAEADDALFNAIGKLDLKQRQMLLGHPASHQFLKGYLGHTTVMARIIAGRKLRWKRDQHLTQSMRIGPAAAGGKGGMKLAGLDKAESARDAREVVDVLQLWRNQVGKLRTAVTAASAMPSVAKLPPVPELAEQMPIKTLKAVEGGITAPHACALCGVKREERIAKVDVEVDDSFGEWWIDGTNMHLSCRDFWIEFEKKLKSR